MSIYDIVKIGKEKQGIASDRAYAIKNGLTEQNISDLKAGRAKNPNALNFLRIARSANMTIDEAIIFLEEKEQAAHKEAGFADVYALTEIASLSLAAVAAANHSPALMALAAGFGGAIYIMRHNVMTANDP